MMEPNRRVKALAFLFSSWLICPQVILGQTQTPATKTPELYFRTVLPKQLFSQDETVEVELQLYSRLEQPLLVSRTLDDEFVHFKLIGPDGKEVSWQAETRANLKEHSPSDFVVLGQYKQTSAKRIVSLNDGTGFAFDKPGQYSLTAEFSMGAPGRFAPFEGQAKTPIGSFRSETKFCIEACILQPLPVRNNAPRAAIDAVHNFYTYIVRYQQLGIPYGPERKATGPLLSKRLALEIDSLQKCDNDYYRRYGKILHARTDKPATPWLEEGLFTGSNEAATPDNFRILSSRAIGDGRVDVELVFTTKQTYDPSLGMPTSYENYEGDVTVILENHRWVIDDYVAMDENDDLQRLSAGYPECKGGQWVGEGPS